MFSVASTEEARLVMEELVKLQLIEFTSLDYDRKQSKMDVKHACVA